MCAFCIVPGSMHRLFPQSPGLLRVPQSSPLIAINPTSIEPCFRYACAGGVLFEFKHIIDIFQQKINSIKNREEPKPFPSMNNPTKSIRNVQLKILQDSLTRRPSHTQTTPPLLAFAAGRLRCGFYTATSLSPVDPKACGFPPTALISELWAILGMVACPNYNFQRWVNDDSAGYSSILGVQPEDPICLTLLGSRPARAPALGGGCC